MAMVFPLVNLIFHIRLQRQKKKMRSFHPGQASFLLSLTIHSISAQLEPGTRLAYPTEFDITPILASTDGLISQEDYASNSDNKECHFPESQRRMRRMRTRAYNQEHLPSALCPYEPGAATPFQYNLKEPPEADQLQLDGTKNDPNNPNPNPHPESEKRKWWERLLTPLQDMVRPGREESNDNWRAPYLSSVICPDPKKQVAVCSAETPYLPGPGQLVIEYCRFRALLFSFLYLLYVLQSLSFFFFSSFLCLTSLSASTYTISLLEKPCCDLTIGNGIPIVTPFVSDCVDGEKAWCCKEVFVTVSEHIFIVKTKSK